MTALITQDMLPPKDRWLAGPDVSVETIPSGLNGLRNDQPGRRFLVGRLLGAWPGLGRVIRIPTAHDPVINSTAPQSPEYDVSSATEVKLLIRSDGTFENRENNS